MNKDASNRQFSLVEARTAVDWLLNRKTSADFRRKLQQVLDRIGHEELAREI